MEREGTKKYHARGPRGILVLMYIGDWRMEIAIASDISSMHIFKLTSRALEI